LAILIFSLSIGTDMAKQVHAAHILVEKEDKVRELLAKINSGENFGELAKKFSKCPSGKQGGDLGWFGKGQMVQEFEKAAFEGQKGATVGPVKTQFGYHLIKVIDQR
jgi:peptidyl-prolyl cis-trans isomerase C